MLSTGTGWQHLVSEPGDSFLQLIRKYFLILELLSDRMAKSKKTTRILESDNLGL